jgi:hypothetical protein
VSTSWRALVVVALLGATVAACSDDGPGEGEAHLEVDGKAVVQRADGESEDVDDSTDLGRGDRVEVTDGVALMRLKGGTTFELREGLSDAASTTVLMDKVPVLEAGDLLVSTPDSTRLEADGTDVVVREGAARLSRAFGMSASAYDADLELDSAGVESKVRALRQVAVPDLGRPRPPRPVQYEDDDPWDRRFLGAAMAFEEDLEKLADELTGRLPRNEGRTAGFFRLVLPSLEDEDAFTPELLSSIDPLHRDQGDTLIGAAITERGKRGSFDDRWRAVFDFRDEGAAWGIVALDQAVQSEPVFNDVELAFNTSANELVSAPVQEPSSGGGQPGGTDSGGSATPPSSGGGGTDGGTRGGGGSTTPTTTPNTLPPPISPPPTSPPSEPPAQLDPVVEPVSDLVDDLLGGLLG